LLFCDFSYAKKQKLWDYQYAFNLKKDRIATVIINKNSKNTKGKSRYTLYLRWTLYANKNLILLVNYMDYPHQFVLQKERLRDRVQIKLLENGGDYNARAYALIVFSDYNTNKNIATINVFIKDQKKRMIVKFKEPTK
jgi:hypothetical protein